MTRQHNARVQRLEASMAKPGRTAMAGEPCLWDALARHGVTRESLLVLLEQLERHTTGAWQWYFRDGFLCEAPQYIPDAYRRVTAQILAGTRLRDAEAYWGLSATRLRAMVDVVCKDANPKLYAQLRQRSHFVLAELRSHKEAFGFGAAPAPPGGTTHGP